MVLRLFLFDCPFVRLDRTGLEYSGSLCGRFISSQIILALSQCSTSHPSGHPSSCQSLYASCRISSSRFISVICIALLLPIEFKATYTRIVFFGKKIFQAASFRENNPGGYKHQEKLV